jgi:hypothetical protein
MSRALAVAIDSLDADQRAALATRTETGTGASWLDRLLYGVHAEIIIEEARKQTALTAFAAEHAAEVDAIDLQLNGTPPPVEGSPAIFDPETGSWIVG